MEGLNLIRRLVKFHPEVITDQTHTVVVAVMNEVKNLRSSVSKLAIMCMAEMFQELKSAMDKVSPVVKSQDKLLTISNFFVNRILGFVFVVMLYYFESMIACPHPDMTLIFFLKEV